MANKRVIDLAELSQTVQEGQYILVDSAGGTGKMDLKRIVDDASTFDPEGTYPDLYAGDLTTDKHETDETPYLFRPSASVGERAYETIVGASCGWNQQARELTSDYWEKTSGNDGTVTFSDGECTYTVATPGVGYKFGFCSKNIIVQGGHKYLISMDAKTSGVAVRLGGDIGNTTFIFANSLTSSYTNCATIISCALSQTSYICTRTLPESGDVIKMKNLMHIDLTALLGSSIADYIYQLESATAGSGIAKLREWGFCTGYAEYDAGSIESVEVTAKVVRDENGENPVTYPLGNDTLRGIFKLDANNNLYADGDVKSADGTITRKDGVVTLDGTEAWTADSNGKFYHQLNDMSEKTDYRLSMICDSMTVFTNSYGQDFADATTGITGFHDSTGRYPNQNWIYAKANGLTAIADFKAWLASHPLTVVYELATPTTEQSTPFTSPQVCYPDGTEQFVTSNNVPVGHSTDYPYSIKALAEELIDIPDVPTANGTYVLKATRSASGITYAWVTG